METGKALVLSEVAKQGNNPFKAKVITQATGLDRRLVSYHLTKFTERGWLEHVGQYYTIIRLSHIVDELTSSYEKESGNKAPTRKGLVSQATANGLNELTRAVVYARVLNVEMSRDMQGHMNERIDETITFFRNLKKYLNNSRPSDRTAARYFLENTTLYESMVETPTIDFTPSHTKTDWLDDVAAKVEGVLG